MDRNRGGNTHANRYYTVALRKESVDRNHWFDLRWIDCFGSLSARRAWIEMAVQELIPLADPVALRKESVDRNISLPSISFMILTSLSARRAWIEIGMFCRCSSLLQSLSARRAWIEIVSYFVPALKPQVALRKESVDRNKHPKPAGQAQGRRSPQGERG